MTEDIVSVEKPLRDKKEYKYFVLENGLRVVLVHDPDIAQSILVGLFIGRIYRLLLM